MEYKILKRLASFPDGGEWTKELNIISWNGRLPKYDIRKWNQDHTKMSKGITLSQEEMRILSDAISLIDLTGDEINA